MPTHPPRLNQITSLLAEAYCNHVEEHCNRNYHPPFPLVVCLFCMSKPEAEFTQGNP